MSASAWLTIKLPTRASFDLVLSALRDAGWSFGESILYYPPGVEAGDWASRRSDELELILDQIRARERANELVGFDLYLGEAAGLFLLDDASLSFQPGVRKRLEDGRTTDVTFHLGTVLLPLRAALPIEAWRWDEDA